MWRIVREKGQPSHGSGDMPVQRSQDRDTILVALYKERAGATPKTFWAAESRKSGVAPARFGPSISGAFSRRDLLTGFGFLGLTDEEGEGLREESGAGRNSYHLHRKRPCASPKSMIVSAES